MYQSRKERAESYFYNMRRFHNHIKRNLYDKYTRNINKLLDLACGKGGDLNKWESNNIKNVIGYDINEKSIMEARKRIEKSKSSTDVKVDVKDLSRNVIDGNKDCDVVTSMFAFHYFFESEDTFNTIMKSIDNNLKVGGYFMGTMFDGKLITDLIKESNTFELVDNNVVRFKLKRYTSVTDDLFGNKLSVFLKDTVLDEPMDEYIVMFDKFVNEMKRRGYELVESSLFDEFYSNTFNMNKVEKRVSFLNRTFVFKRIEKSFCVQEADYLVECEWSIKPEDMKRIQLVKKYKKALNNKIEKESDNNKKNDYILVRDNLDNIHDENLPKRVRNYIEFINKEIDQN